jgi:DNA gyrase subunit B
MHHKVFENEEIRNIFTALGVTVGTAEDSKALNLEKLRYHKVIIMCDADVDGSHIATLILTFFFRFMKELIEEGHVYIAAHHCTSSKKGTKRSTPGQTTSATQPTKEWAAAPPSNVIKVWER